MNMKRAQKRIAIIGGGITGLTAAYRIKQKIEKENLPFELILLEGSLKVGGIIYTMKTKNRFIDLGAESIDTRYPEALELIKELKLENQLIYSDGNKPDVFFYNRLYQLDYPTYNGIPFRRKDIWKGNLLTMYGKIVTYKSYFNTFKEFEKDVETSAYLKRLLGDEMVEHIVEPFFNKIYSSDLDKIGIKASKELIYGIEMKYGSLQKGLAAHPELLDSSGNYMTFENGLAVLTNALEEVLRPHIQYRKKVFEIKKNVENVYIIDINHTEQVRVGAICIATPVTEYTKLIEHPEIDRIFNKIETASVGYIVFGFSKDAIKNIPKGFGIVTPRRSDSFVTSVVFLDKKWPSLKKDEDVLIGVNFGRNGEDALVSLSNKEIEHSLLKDLGIILGVTEKPLFSIIKRWRDAVPQFTVTQEEDVQQAKQILLDEYPGIYIAGQGLAGSSINHCIQQANQIADQIVEYAKKQNCL